jgi:hypothetical protein
MAAADRPSTTLRRTFLGLAAGAVLAAGLGVLGCDPAKRPEDEPGPAGCGLRDPRDTAPGMLSLAQKTTLQKNGKPDEVAKNDQGGLDWVYRVKAGGVFGEEETVTVLTFDAGGVLKASKKDLLRKVGK